MAVKIAYFKPQRVEISKMPINKTNPTVAGLTCSQRENNTTIAATMTAHPSRRRNGLLKRRFTCEYSSSVQIQSIRGSYRSMPKTPEQWLEETTPRKREPVFKLFLGYAPGVGKTFNMLSEGIRRRRRGEEVVIGMVETHGRKNIVELSSKLETVPRRKLQYKGTVFEEMDVDAILARRPQVVLVDELAHTNIEGSKHAKRYEDVMELLDAHIDVLSTMNVQHIESLMPMVHSITG